MEKYISFDVNGKKIRGIIHFPQATEKSNNSSYPAIVLCHGFIGNKIGLHGIYVKTARFFSKAGYVVLRFDFSGCGDSDGTYDEITIDGQIAEAAAALKIISGLPEVNEKEVYLLGLSMGGAVASLTAARYQNIAGLILWAPVARMYDDIRGIVGDKIINEVWEKGLGDYIGYPLGKPFLESLQRNHPLQEIKKFKKSVLIIHGTADQDISYKNAGLYNESRKGLPTKVQFIQDADHTFSSLKWENEVFSLTENWLNTFSEIITACKLLLVKGF